MLTNKVNVREEYVDRVDGSETRLRAGIADQSKRLRKLEVHPHKFKNAFKGEGIEERFDKMRRDSFWIVFFGLAGVVVVLWLFALLLYPPDLCVKLIVAALGTLYGIVSLATIRKPDTKRKRVYWMDCIVEQKIYDENRMLENESIPYRWEFKGRGINLVEK